MYGKAALPKRDKGFIPLEKQAAVTRAERIHLHGFNFFIWLSLSNFPSCTENENKITQCTYGESILQALEIADVQALFQPDAWNLVHFTEIRRYLRELKKFLDNSVDWRQNKTTQKTCADPFVEKHS